MMNEYGTLGQIRAYLEASNLEMVDADDRKLLQYLAWASRRVESWCNGRRFYPRVETRHYDYQGDARRLILDDDLLALTTLTVDGTAISSGDIVQYPLTGYPKWRIEMDRSGTALFTYADTPQDAVQVAGTWGWHEDWDNAWADSGDTVQDDPSLGAAATTLTVSDVDGVDVDGYEPRISAGALLKIESEYLAVTETDRDDNTVTVRRGVNGTTAAAHNSGKVVYVFRPAEAAVGATLDLAKWVYEHRSAVGGILALPSLEGAAIRTQVADVLGAWELPRRLTIGKGR